MRFIFAVMFLFHVTQAAGQDVVVVLRKGSMIVGRDTLKSNSGKTVLKDRSRLVMGAGSSGYAYLLGRNNMLELLPKQRWTRERLVSAIQASDISISTRFASLLLSKDLEGNTSSKKPNYGGLSRGVESGGCHPADADTLIGDTVCWRFGCVNGSPAYMTVILNGTDTLFAGKPVDQNPCLPIEGSGAIAWRVFLRNGSTGHTGVFYRGDARFTRSRTEIINSLRSEISLLGPELQNQIVQDFLDEAGWILN